jgi:DNA-directed RNA polymerase specialized sigma24 family protein
MTKDELKKLLHSYRDLKDEHKQIALELEQVEAFMTAPKGTNWDGMPRGGRAGDPILNVVSQHINLQERYQAKLAELAAAQTQIEELIDSLEPRERKLMRHRYIEGLSWEEVCVAMCYSWRQTHNIHGNALDKILEQINGPKPKPAAAPDPCDGCIRGDCQVCLGYE